MAKIKFTAFMADMRGKVNGTVFSRNKGGAYARTKVTPVNPQSTAQALIRSRLTGRTQAWRGLTEAQRLAWNDASINFPRTNIFGDTVYLSGQQLYIGLNNNLINTGTTPISSPPTPQMVSAITSASLAIAAGAGTASLTFAPTPVPANTAFLIFATPGVSPGRLFVKNLYKQITVLAAAATSPANIAAAYTTVFGSVPSAGQKVFLKIIPVNTISGQQGQAFEIMAVVAA